MLKSNQYKRWDFSKQDDWCFVSKMSQSPINVNTNEVVPMRDKGKIELNYEKKLLDLFDTGCAIQGNMKGTAKINGRLFELQQFHFHAHSEHQIDQLIYPLELHLVHQSQSGKLAVIALLFELGEENQVLKNMVNAFQFPLKDHYLALADLIPLDRTFYHYQGSLTSPPLTENVEWYLFSNPISLSPSQLKMLTKHYPHNHRNIQPLNKRPILIKKDK